MVSLTITTTTMSACEWNFIVKNYKKNNGFDRINQVLPDSLTIASRVIVTKYLFILEFTFIINNHNKQVAYKRNMSL